MKQLKYKYNQKLRIKNGFYKGFTGQVKEHKTNKEQEEYLLQYEREGKTIKEWFKEEELETLIFGIL